MVVSYSISTSNHNLQLRKAQALQLYLIPFLHQTTTGNVFFRKRRLLYLIPFLHQTTTFSWRISTIGWLYLIPFLHQTTTCISPTRATSSCILFHFYIKPQLNFVCTFYTFVVSYSISTSNHNSERTKLERRALYLIPFLHQTTTEGATYIEYLKLYLIPFLHQTTTPTNAYRMEAGLYLIPFLHQTTTYSVLFLPGIRCILFHFYIKPQPIARLFNRSEVVSYSISTSNHNSFTLGCFWLFVVSYSISTSNHNALVQIILILTVVSYSISTSNHNLNI